MFYNKSDDTKKLCRMSQHCKSSQTESACAATSKCIMSQSIPTGYIPPGQPPGISSKRLPGGSGFDFRNLPGGREFDKGGDFVEIESETFCPSVGFISDK